jgi:hypothetical protein
MESKTQGTLGALVQPLVCKHLESKMETLTRMDPGMDMVVIEDYCDMTIVYESVN